MFSFINPKDGQSAMIRILVGFIILLMGIILVQILIAYNKQKNLRIDLPSDISMGAELTPNKIYNTTIYNYAYRVFQALHHWKVDGFVEYKANIARYSKHQTPAYNAFLKRDYDRREKSGELSNRGRIMLPIPGSWKEDSVKITRSENGIPVSWVVYLDFEVKETYNGVDLKTVYLRYPIKVVLFDIDRTTNEWGLALNGYQSKPEEFSYDYLETEGKENL